MTDVDKQYSIIGDTYSKNIGYVYSGYPMVAIDNPKQTYVQMDVVGGHQDSGSARYYTFSGSGYTYVHFSDGSKLLWASLTFSTNADTKYYASMGGMYDVGYLTDGPEDSSYIQYKLSDEQLADVVGISYAGGYSAGGHSYGYLTETVTPVTWEDE